MLKKAFIYLVRAGVGFFFLYPALERLTQKTGTLSTSIFACFTNSGLDLSPHFMWLTWNLFFIVLGLMIAFWKKPLSWIIFGVIILIFKLVSAPTITYKLLLETIPVLLVALALAIYYGKDHGSH